MWLLMQIQENVSLQALNTFGIDASAHYFATPENEKELSELLEWAKKNAQPVFVLGGGSNIIFSSDFKGLVIQPAMKGVILVQESDNKLISDNKPVSDDEPVLGNEVIVEVGAGETWHDFVQYTLSQGWYGLENLSLIPGTVGAAPVQNIGAYGVELKDYLESVTTVAIASGERRIFSRPECRFSYRDSIFKQAEKDKQIIVRARFRLLKKPQLKLDYGDIRQELQSAGIATPTPKDVANAVIAIRQRKLPDPQKIGNAGSFFKNPVVSAAYYESLKEKFPSLVAYPQGEYVKLAAGWLIEQAGWKGKQLGNVGSYAKQSLVLVNHGGATGAEVMAMAKAIQQSVQEKFDVLLEMEPVVFGN